MVAKVTVKIKGDDSTFKKDFLIYETFSLCDGDETINNCVNEAKQEAKIDAKEILLTAKISIL